VVSDSGGLNRVPLFFLLACASEQRLGNFWSWGSACSCGKDRGG